MAPQDERHTSRHTGRARIAQLGSVQRRLLVGLLADVIEQNGGNVSRSRRTSVRWRPSKSPVSGFEPKDAPALSANIRILETRGLVKLRRHEGGRIHAVVFTYAGWEAALFFDSFGESPAERRKRVQKLLPDAVVAYVPVAYRELRKANVPEGRRNSIGAFVKLYRSFLAILEGREDDLGSDSLASMHRTIVNLHAELTSSEK